ncbi:MAG: antA/AntB antirepressor family protein [Miniphocaeibacter sp.]|uniref:antA/AntB antirepressor family protein n=1 Tax=Miniphocaeibacter sp. TaxID=3100973 RepID=UPI003BB09B70
MNHLIPINYKDDAPTVIGRELYEALEVKTPYDKWFPRMCEYGFTEGLDFTTFLSESTGGRPAKEHQVKIPMAKELCMLQRSEMGKKFRQYFIAVEEAWNSPEKIMERALQIAQQKSREAELKIFALVEENETLEIALNESLKFFTVAKYNRVFNMGWNLRECQILGKRLSAYCRSHSIEIRKCETNDERFGSVNSYPLTAWDDYLEVLE